MKTQNKQSTKIGKNPSQKRTHDCKMIINKNKKDLKQKNYALLEINGITIVIP
jgi:hypothetical protein